MNNENDLTISSIRERLVAVEENQKHQKEILTDVAKSLQEVVKTQHILANQKEEIEKLTVMVVNSQDRIHELQIQKTSLSLLLNSTTVTLDHIQKDNDALKPKVNTLLTISKWGAGILGAVIIALITTAII